jgi:hypothetical protein
MHNTPDMHRHKHSSDIHERLYRSRGPLAIVHFLAFLAAPYVVFCVLSETTNRLVRFCYLYLDSYSFCSLRRKSSSTTASSHSFGNQYLSWTTHHLIKARNGLPRPAVTRCHLGMQQIAQHKMNTNLIVCKTALLPDAVRGLKQRLKSSSTIRCYGNPTVW